jgi:hypothetical protein
VVGAVLSALKKRTGYSNLLLDFIPIRLPLAGFRKLLVRLQEICHPKGAKDFNLPVFQKLSDNSKAFGT